MPKFRKKPIEIEAIQFTGDNVRDIWDAFGADGIYGPTEKNPDHLILTTVHGDEAPARPGDWVIPDGKPGTFYPCKPDIFAATYEPVAEAAATEATESPLLDQIYQAMKERYLDNALDLGQTSPKHQIASLANAARAVAVSHGKVLAAQHRNAEEQLLAARTRVQEVEDERDGAYRERAHLVALLATMTPGAVIAPAPDVDEPGWQIAYLTIGDRQASWHIAPRDAGLFEAIVHVPTDHPRAQWDGHTTEEKYEHLAALARQHDAEVRVEVHIQADPTHVADAIRDIRRHGDPPNYRR